MERGGAIINTASVNAAKGHAMLIDYSATKGAKCGGLIRCGARIRHLGACRC